MQRSNPARKKNWVKCVLGLTKLKYTNFWQYCMYCQYIHFSHYLNHILGCCSSKADGHFLIVKNTIEGEHGCCNGETYLMHTESCTRNMYGIKMVTPLRP